MTKELLDLHLLERKIDALASMPRLRPETVRYLGSHIRGLDEWGRLQLNPLRFAQEHGLSATEATDLFVHGAKVGLFDFMWNLICPSCGAVVVSHDSVNGMTALAHCAMCDVPVEGSLDDQVEVAFALNSSVARHRIDPYADGETYWRHAFSPNFHHSERVTEIVRDLILGIELPGPDESASFDLDAKAGETYTLVSVERNVAAYLATADGGATEVAFDLLPTGIFPAEVAVAPGRVSITVRNLCKTAAGLTLIRDEERIHEYIHEHPPRMDAFLTGKLLLNNQSFRELFRIQQLVPGLRLPMRSITLLFTDLKGSTALYDRTGDAYAYALVQEHYEHLAEAVRASSGAVVKTMGDAIMASFSHPRDAVRAAVEMVDRIDGPSTSWSRDGHDLGLKVGLHEGPALAVNADDRLDYFGQTVNIAARVQGLAEAGEIWHTESMLQAPGVEELLRSHGYGQSAHSVSLKGVGAPVSVRQWRRD